MFKELKQNNTHIIFDESLLEEVNENTFNGNYWQSKKQVIGSATGRGTTWFIQLNKMQGALRHYCRGGLFGKIISDHYIFTGWKKTRSTQEFYLLDKLNKAGVNVPRPIAAQTIKRNFCYQADLLSEKIPNATDLVDVLQKQTLSAITYQKIGQEIKKMHNEQVNHTDLNIHNILLDQQGNVWIIDFDKCYQQSGESWKQSNLDRLLRSFRKELKKRNVKWQESDFKALNGGYTKGTIKVSNLA